MTEESKGLSVQTERVSITTQAVSWKDVQFPTLYANVFMVSVTPVDVSLIFGELDSANASNIFATPRFKLILAPEFAATVMTGLANGLNLFTEANGALRPNAPFVPTNKEFAKK